MKSYRNRETVPAYQVAEPGEVVFTVSGPRWAPSGSWVVYKAGGVTVMDDVAFQTMFEEQADPEQDLKTENGVAENGGEVPQRDPGTFRPEDHSVVEVLAYLDANPEEVAWIQELESEGLNRKGIMQYR